MDQSNQEQYTHTHNRLSTPLPPVAGDFNRGEKRDAALPVAHTQINLMEEHDSTEATIVPRVERIKIRSNKAQPIMINRTVERGSFCLQPTRAVEIPKKPASVRTRIVDARETLLVGGDGDCWYKLWQPLKRAGAVKLFQRAAKAFVGANPEKYPSIVSQNAEANQPIDLEFIIRFVYKNSYMVMNHSRLVRWYQEFSRAKQAGDQVKMDKLKKVKPEEDAVEYNEYVQTKDGPDCKMADLVLVALTETAEGLLHIESVDVCGDRETAYSRLDEDIYPLEYLMQMFIKKRKERQLPNDIRDEVANEAIKWHSSGNALQLAHNQATQLQKLNIRSSMERGFKTVLLQKIMRDKVKVGVSASYLMRSKFIENLEFALDDTGVREYLEAVTDHDMRVVNNTFARVTFNHLRTTQPDKRCDISSVKELDSLFIMQDEITHEEPTERFLTDICTAFTFVNTDPEVTNYDEELLAGLHSQPYYAKYLEKLDEVKNEHERQRKPLVLVSKQPTREDLLSYDLVFLIGPVIGHDSEGSLPNELGYYKWMNSEECHYSFADTTKSKSCGFLSGVLCGSNNVSVNNRSVTVVARRTFDAMQVVILTSLAYQGVQVAESTVREFEIPVIAPTSLWATGIPILKTMKCKLNNVLLKRLVNKNLTGKVSKELLLEYGMALSWYSYNKRGVEISDHKLDPWDVKVHVYVAMVLTRREALATELQHQITKPGLNAVLASFLATMVEATMSNVDTKEERFQTMISSIMDKLKTPNIKSNTGVILKNWMSIDFWTLRDEFEVNKASAIVACSHHAKCPLEVTGNMCIDCGYLTAAEGEEWCVCCDILVCQHDRPADQFGDKVCDCCGDPTNGTTCGSCAAIKGEDSITTMHNNTACYNFRPTTTKAGDGTGHTHTCVKCGNRYSHSHPYSNLQHLQTLEECDWCHGRKTTKEKGKPGKAEDKPIVKFINAQGEVVESTPAQPTKQTFAEAANSELPVRAPIELMNLSEYAVYLPQNAAAILMGEIADTELCWFSETETSTIPFVCMDHPIEPVSNFEVIVESEESTDEDCGVACIKAYVGAEYTQTAGKLVTGKTKLFSGLDLAKVLNQYGINACIIEPLGVVFSRANDSEEFACIMHKDLSQTQNVDHWVTCKIKRIAYVNNDKWAMPLFSPRQHNMHSTNLKKKKYELLDDHDKLDLAFRVVSSMTITGSDSEFVLDYDRGNLTNNKEKKHDPQRGKISFQVPEKFQEDVQLLVNCLKNGAVDDKFNAVWDKIGELTLEFDYNVRHSFLSTCLQLTLTFSDPESHCRSGDAKVIQYKGHHVIDLSNRDPKPGDVVFVSSKGKQLACTVDANQQIKVKLSGTAVRVKMLIPKASVLSALIHIFTTTTASFDGAKLKSLIERSSGAMGVGGAGKSTHIAELARKLKNEKRKTLICTNTNKGMRSLNEKLDKDLLAYTFERASYLKIKANVVIIDEATLMSPWQLALIANGNEDDLYVFGDPAQIEFIDFSKSGGHRSESTLMDYCQKYGNIEQWWTSHRYGRDLVKALKLHPKLDKLETDAEHNTVVELYYHHKFDLDMIRPLITGMNLVLVHYRDQIKRVRNLTSNASIIEVTTPHGYQGGEVDNVLVIQCPEGSATTHLQPGHNISAATRARKKLRWLSINCFDAQTPLHERLGGLIGRNFKLDFGTVKQVKVTTDKGEDLEYNLEFEKVQERIGQAEMPEKYSAENFDFPLFQDLLGSFTNMARATDFEVTGNKVTLKATSIGMEATLTVDLDELTVDGPVPHSRKKNLLSLVAWCCTGGSHPRITRKLDHRGWYRCRIIAFVHKLYDTHNKKLNLKGKLNGYTVTTKATSCAACTDIYFEKDGRVTHVEEDYMRSDSRHVVGHEVEKICEVLESPETWDILRPELDDENLSQVIVTERFNTAFTEVFASGKPTGNVMWYNRYENDSIRNNLLRRFNVEIKTSKHDNMFWYHIRIRKGISWHVERPVDNKTREVIKTARKPSVQTLAHDTLLSMLGHYSKKRVVGLVSKMYTKFVGAADDRLPGMVESIEYHKQKKTKVFTAISGRVGKLMVTSLKNKKPMVLVCSSEYKAIKKWGVNHRFGSVNSDHALSSPDTASELLALVAVSTGLNDAQIDTCFTNCYAQYICGTTGNNILTKQDLNNTLTSSRVLKGFFDKALKNHLSRVPANTEIYQSLMQTLADPVGAKTQSSNVLVTTMSLFGEDSTWYGALINKYEKVFIILPMRFRMIEGKQYTGFEGSSRVYEVPEFIRKGLRSTPVNLGNKRYFVHICRVIDEVCILELDENNNHWASHWSTNSRYIWLDVPSIVLDPEEVLNNKKLITSVKKRYDVSIVANLRRRALRSGTTENDLIVQARTLVNTAQFSITNVFDKYDVPVHAAKDAVKLALHVHETENRMLSLVSGDGWADDLKTVGWKVISDMLSKFVPNHNVDTLLDKLSPTRKQAIIENIKPFFEKLAMLGPVLMRDRKIFSTKSSDPWFNTQLKYWKANRTAYNFEPRYQITSLTYCNCDSCSTDDNMLEAIHLYELEGKGCNPTVNPSPQYTLVSTNCPNRIYGTLVSTAFDAQPLNPANSGGACCPVKRARKTVHPDPEQPGNTIEHPTGEVVCYVDCTVELGAMHWSTYATIALSINCTFKLTEGETLRFASEENEFVEDGGRVVGTLLAKNLKEYEQLNDATLKTTEIGKKYPDVVAVNTETLTPIVNRKFSRGKLNVIIPCNHGKGLIKYLLNKWASDVSVKIHDESMIYTRTHPFDIAAFASRHDIVLASDMPKGDVSISVIYAGTNQSLGDPGDTRYRYHKNTDREYLESFKREDCGVLHYQWSDLLQLSKIVEELFGVRLPMQKGIAACGHVVYKVKDVDAALGGIACSTCGFEYQKYEFVYTYGLIDEIRGSGQYEVSEWKDMNQKSTYRAEGSVLINANKFDSDVIPNIEGMEYTFVRTKDGPVLLTKQVIDTWDPVNSIKILSTSHNRIIVEETCDNNSRWYEEGEEIQWSTFGDEFEELEYEIVDATITKLKDLETVKAEYYLYYCSNCRAGYLCGNNKKAGLCPLMHSLILLCGPTGKSRTGSVPYVKLFEEPSELTEQGQVYFDNLRSTMTNYLQDDNTTTSKVGAVITEVNGVDEEVPQSSTRPNSQPQDITNFGAMITSFTKDVYTAQTRANFEEDGTVHVLEPLNLSIQDEENKSRLPVPVNMSAVDEISMLMNLLEISFNEKLTAEKLELHMMTVSCLAMRILAKSAKVRLARQVDINRASDSLRQQMLRERTGMLKDTIERLRDEDNASVVTFWVNLIKQTLQQSWSARKMTIDSLYSKISNGNLLPRDLVEMELTKLYHSDYTVTKSYLCQAGDDEEVNKQEVAKVGGNKTFAKYAKMQKRADKIFAIQMLRSFTRSEVLREMAKSEEHEHDPVNQWQPSLMTIQEDDDDDYNSFEYSMTQKQLLDSTYTSVMVHFRQSEMPKLNNWIKKMLLLLTGRKVVITYLDNERKLQINSWRTEEEYRDNKSFLSNVRSRGIYTIVESNGSLLPDEPNSPMALEFVTTPEVAETLCAKTAEMAEEEKLKLDVNVEDVQIQYKPLPENSVMATDVYRSHLMHSTPIEAIEDNTDNTYKDKAVVEPTEEPAGLQPEQTIGSKMSDAENEKIRKIFEEHRALRGNNVQMMSLEAQSNKERLNKHKRLIIQAMEENGFNLSHVNKLSRCDPQTVIQAINWLTGEVQLGRISTEEAEGQLRSAIRTDGSFKFVVRQFQQLNEVAEIDQLFKDLNQLFNLESLEIVKSHDQPGAMMDHDVENWIIRKHNRILAEAFFKNRREWPHLGPDPSVRNWIDLVDIDSDTSRFPRHPTINKNRQMVEYKFIDEDSELSPIEAVTAKLFQLEVGSGIRANVRWNDEAAILQWEVGSGVWSPSKSEIQEVVNCGPVGGSVVNSWMKDPKGKGRYKQIESIKEESYDRTARCNEYDLLIHSGVCKLRGSMLKYLSDKGKMKVDNRGGKVATSSVVTTNAMRAAEAAENDRFSTLMEKLDDYCQPFEEAWASHIEPERVTATAVPTIICFCQICCRGNLKKSDHGAVPKEWEWHHQPARSEEDSNPARIRADEDQASHPSSQQEGNTPSASGERGSERSDNSFIKAWRMGPNPRSKTPSSSSNDGESEFEDAISEFTEESDYTVRQQEWKSLRPAVEPQEVGVTGESTDDSDQGPLEPTEETVGSVDMDTTVAKKPRPTTGVTEPVEGDQSVIEPTETKARPYKDVVEEQLNKQFPNKEKPTPKTEVHVPDGQPLADLITNSLNNVQAERAAYEHRPGAKFITNLDQILGYKRIPEAEQEIAIRHSDIDVWYTKGLTANAAYGMRFRWMRFHGCHTYGDLLDWFVNRPYKQWINAANAKWYSFIAESTEKFLTRNGVTYAKLCKRKILPVTMPGYHLNGTTIYLDCLSSEWGICLLAMSVVLETMQPWVFKRSPDGFETINPTIYDFSCCTNATLYRGQPDRLAALERRERLMATVVDEVGIDVQSPNSTDTNSFALGLAMSSDGRFIYGLAKNCWNPLRPAIWAAQHGVQELKWVSDLRVEVHVAPVGTKRYHSHFTSWLGLQDSLLNGKISPKWYSTVNAVAIRRYPQEVIAKYYNETNLQLIATRPTINWGHFNPCFRHQRTVGEQCELCDLEKANKTEPIGVPNTLNTVNRLWNPIDPCDSGEEAWYTRYMGYEKKDKKEGESKRATAETVDVNEISDPEMATIGFAKIKEQVMTDLTAIVTGESGLPEFVHSERPMFRPALRRIQRWETMPRAVEPHPALSIVEWLDISQAQLEAEETTSSLKFDPNGGAGMIIPEDLDVSASHAGGIQMCNTPNDSEIFDNRHNAALIISHESIVKASNPSVYKNRELPVWAEIDDPMLPTDHDVANSIKVKLATELIAHVQEVAPPMIEGAGSGQDVVDLVKRRPNQPIAGWQVVKLASTGTVNPSDRGVQELGDGEKLFCQLFPEVHGTTIKHPIMDLADEPLVRRPLFHNPLVPKRFAYGRDILCKSLLHWVDTAALEARGLNERTKKCLIGMLLRINKLQIKEGEILHWYGLHEGVATRKPGVGKGRHICFTTQPEKYQQLGFETVLIDAEPYRLGASLRLIAIALMHNFNVIHVPKGGRVTLHSLAVEHAVAKYLEPVEWDAEKRRFNNLRFYRAGFTMFSSYSPNMDGMVLLKPPSTILQSVIPNIVNHKVYGIDECNPGWFDLQACYVAEGTRNTYSNTSTLYDYLIQGVMYLEIRKLLEDLSFPVTFAISSTNDINKYVKLAWALDQHSVEVDTRTSDDVAPAPEVVAWMAKHVSIGNKTATVDSLSLLRDIEQVNPEQFTVMSVTKEGDTVKITNGDARWRTAANSAAVVMLAKKLGLTGILRSNCGGLTWRIYVLVADDLLLNVGDVKEASDLDALMDLSRTQVKDPANRSILINAMRQAGNRKVKAASKDPTRSHERDQRNMEDFDPVQPSLGQSPISGGLTHNGTKILYYPDSSVFTLSLGTEKIHVSMRLCNRLINEINDQLLYEKLDSVWLPKADFTADQCPIPVNIQWYADSYKNKMIPMGDIMATITQNHQASLLDKSGERKYNSYLTKVPIPTKNLSESDVTSRSGGFVRKVKGDNAYQVKTFDLGYTKGYPIREKFNVNVLRVIYSPRGADGCAPAVIRMFCLQVDRNANVDELMQFLPVDAWSSAENIVASLNLLNINHTIVRNNVAYSTINNNTNQFLNLEIIKNSDGSDHIQMVEFIAKGARQPIDFQRAAMTSEFKTAFKALSDELNSKEAYINDSNVKVDDPSPSLMNAAIRAKGNPHHYFVTNSEFAEVTSRLGEDLWVLSGSTPGSMYRLLTPDGPRFALSFKIGKMVMLRSGTPPAQHLKPWCKVVMAGKQPGPHRVIVPKQDAGFLSKKDKTYAVHMHPSIGNLPVKPEAAVIYVSNWSNRNHHMLRERDIMMSKTKEQIFIMHELKIEPISNEWDQVIRIGGPLRAEIIDGKINAMWCCWYGNAKKAIRLLNEGPLDDIYEIACLWDNNNFVTIGNDIIPKGSEWRSMFEKKTEIETTGQEIKQLLEQMGVEGADKVKIEGKYKLKLQELELVEYWLNPNYEMLTPGKLISCKHLCKLEWSSFGAGYMSYIQKETEQYQIDEHAADRFVNYDDIAQPKKQGQGDLDDKMQQANLDQVTAAIDSLSTLNNLSFNDESDVFTIVSGDAEQNALIYGCSTTTDPINGEITRTSVDPRTMNYWDDETAMVDGTIELPYKNIKLQVFEDFKGVTQEKKSKLADYPSHSQPAYTKRYMAGTQAVSDLFGKTLELRQVAHDPVADAKLFAQTYFKAGSLNALQEVGLDPSAIKEWLLERPDSVKIAADVLDLLSGGLDVLGLDKVNVHMKLESRMKDQVIHLNDLLTMAGDNRMPETIEEQRVRLIVWQRKGIAAIFSPFFKKLKDNLKRCLIDKVVYVDGMTPQQISYLLNKVSGDVMFAEDDLAKQDRQTDHTLLDTEMEVYKLLGGNTSIIKLWRNVHNHWRAKGVGVKFTGDASRHTGQATTALGNAIVNLMVKRRVVAEQGNRLKLMMVLGDDNIILTEGPITASEITLNSARHFNMKSEASVNNHNGGFLRMLIYKNNVNSLECGPDIIRLRRRFEVLNGVHESTDENVTMRAMSYCMMLGNLKPVQELIRKHNWPIKPSRWYDYQALSNGLAMKYNCTSEEVDVELSRLIDMMDRREVTEVSKLMFTGKSF
uniref:Polyprotein n=1 Tax=Rhizoctonia solani endornavirus 4 TaxID=2599610 RepID=A0A5B8GRT1_9VIRU|nr:polyprotein [Rhizoctonia solani endornavirus 4]